MESIPKDQMQNQVPNLMHSFTLDFVKTMEKRPNFTFPLIIIGNDKYKVSEILASTNLEVPCGTLDEKKISTVLKNALQPELDSTTNKTSLPHIESLLEFFENTE